MIRTSDRSGLAVALSVFLATFTIKPLTVDTSFLGASWLLIILLSAIGIIMRRVNLGAPTVFIAQLIIYGGYLLVSSASMQAESPSWYDHVVALYQQGAEHMRTQSTPMSPDDGVKLIFITGIGAVLIITDLLVGGLRHPVWALAPPTALFLIPAVGLADDVGVTSFLCIAAGYLGILLAEGLNSATRWTRGLSHDSAGSGGTASPVVWRAAGYLGVFAVVAALVFSMIVPMFQVSGWGFGSGSNSQGPLQLTDPTLDLRRNLNQPSDKTVITYTTDQPGGTYLRMASLPLFNNDGWQIAPMKIDLDAKLPAVPGLEKEPKQKRTTTITVGDFQSDYLPLPYAPRRIEAQGRWGSDPDSLVMISTRGGRGIRNLQYTVQSVDIVPDASALEDAAVGKPPDADITAVVPKDLPRSLINLTKQVIAGQRTPAMKAAAIQAYLRSSRFTYSTDPQPGSGYRALENFLLKDHMGYCEQFAGAMAMMARIAGIPSRVAVGFLPGTQIGDTYQVSIRQMHAWPELYFADYGWVRFEPTPASVTGLPPAWTLAATTESDSGSDIQPSLAAPTEESSASPEEEQQESTSPQDLVQTTRFPIWRTVGWIAVGLVGLLILAAPATIRVRRRSGRLSIDQLPDHRVEAAWSEIRDTLIDLGGSWPAGSPRMIGEEVAERLAQDESEKMRQVATLVEQSRYARTISAVDTIGVLPRLTEDIRQGLSKPRSRTRRIIAALAPRSLFHRHNR